MVPKRVGVVGAGYVGVTLAAVLADLGHEVVCADIDPERVASLAAGGLPFAEAGLEPLVRTGIEAGRLRFVVGAAGAADGAEFVFLCVPTPEGIGGGADLSAVLAAAHEIAPVLPAGAVVVNKSTVPVGTTLVVEEALGRDDVSVASNPEFLRQGSAVHDARRPDRIIVGCDDQSAAVRVAALYEPLHAPVLITDPASAETVKYAANAFLATRISFMNAVANLCEAVGADVRDVALGMGYDPRIGFEYMRPGPGWGGSCLPKDAAALVRMGEEAGYDFSLLRGAIAVNEEQRERVVDKVVRMAGGSVDGVRVAAWGLAFKARTDDVRHSPAVAVVEHLRRRGAVVATYDPAVAASSAGDLYAACDGASVLVVLTEWEEFRLADLGKVASVMAAPRIVDARNLLDAAACRRHGFVYECLGRR